MKKAAFSLVELIVVIAIIGILSAVAIPAYKKYTLKAQLIDVVHTLQECRKEIEIGYQETDKYPNSAIGLTLHAAATAINTSTIANMYYDSSNTFNADGSSSGMVWCAAQISTTLIPSGGTLLHVGAVRSASQKKLIWFCGAWQPNAQWALTINPQYIQYLPAECNNQNVLSSLTGVT